MRRRKFFAMAALAVLLLPDGVRAQSATDPFRSVALSNGHAPIFVDRVAPAGVQQPFGSFIVSKLCLTFHNLDPRTATSVKFHFVYYDQARERVGETVLTRKGTFTTGALIEGFNMKTGKINDENCANIQFPKEGIAINAFFVESVTFADGSQWNAKVPPIPQSLPSPSPSSSPVPSSSPSPG